MQITSSQPQVGLRACVCVFVITGAGWHPQEWDKGVQEHWSGWVQHTRVEGLDRPGMLCVVCFSLIWCSVVVRQSIVIIVCSVPSPSLYPCTRYTHTTPTSHTCEPLPQNNPPYNKGAFKIEINFPAEYPFKPPKVCQLYSHTPTFYTTPCD